MFQIVYRFDLIIAVTLFWVTKSFDLFLPFNIDVINIHANPQIVVMS